MLFLSYRCFADSLPIVSPSWSLFQFFPLIVSSRRQQKSKEIPNACCCSRWILRLLLNEARAEEIAGIAGRTELSAFPHTGDAITFRPHAANACGGETCETLPPSEELRWFNGAGQKPAESLSIRRIKTPRSHFRNHFRSGGSKALQNHFRSGGSRALRNHFRSGGSNACRATFDPADQKPAESLWIRRIKSLRNHFGSGGSKALRNHFGSGGSKACGGHFRSGGSKPRGVREVTFDPADQKPAGSLSIRRIQSRWRLLAVVKRTSVVARGICGKASPIGVCRIVPRGKTWRPSRGCRFLPLTEGPAVRCEYHLPHTLCDLHRADTAGDCADIADVATARSYTPLSPRCRNFARGPFKSSTTLFGRYPLGSVVPADEIRCTAREHRQGWNLPIRRDNALTRQPTELRTRTRRICLRRG